MTPEITKNLAAFWKGPALWNHPMADFSSLKVGGPAEVVLVADEVEQLTGLIPWLQERHIPWRLIGRGSNILVSDRGIRGAVILLGDGFKSLALLDTTAENSPLLKVGAGCSLMKMIAFCVAEGLSGAEFLVGIPGSIGGAIVMNAGAWGMEISEITCSVTVLKPSGLIAEKSRRQCDFSYRQWGGNEEDIVIAATFRLKRGRQKEIAATCEKLRQMRMEKQPLHLPSAGSFFKNPPAETAGRLIEQAGLKGYRVGGAMVSEQHANFIVNTGNATAKDIFDLFHRIRAEVMTKFNILLEPEIHILGEPEEG